MLSISSIRKNQIFIHCTANTEKVQSSSLEFPGKNSRFPNFSQLNGSEMERRFSIFLMKYLLNLKILITQAPNKDTLFFNHKQRIKRLLKKHKKFAVSIVTYIFWRGSNNVRVDPDFRAE